MISKVNAVKECKWEFDLPGKQSGMPPGSRAGGDMKMTSKPAAFRIALTATQR
jgi:hypothetical protein